jgi:hypothetical protein
MDDLGETYISEKSAQEEKVDSLKGLFVSPADLNGQTSTILSAD